jgi:hypothetical protein
VVINEQTETDEVIIAFSVYIYVLNFYRYVVRQKGYMMRYNILTFKQVLKCSGKFY